VNITLLWFLALPLSLGLGLWYILGQSRDSAITGGMFAGAGSIVLAIVFWGSAGVATADTEIWNGKITGKTRDHGTYEQPYDCNCRNVTSGSGKNQTTTRVCDTCYETHYTVKWDCASTVGSFRIDSRDSTSRSVYNTPNPQRWTMINVGDPAAASHSYTNYVQAVPQTLFSPASSSLKSKFASMLPAYPINVYDFYRNDHFVTVGYSTPDAPAWNAEIANLLRDLGPAKQVNAIVVIAKTDDPNYEYALRDHWEGANKNDVVLLIGSAEWPRIDFVRVLSWTKNELFKVQLRDSIQDLQTIQRGPIIQILGEQISKNFQRRHMAEFKYLDAEIDPPTWVLVLITVLEVLAAVGIWIAVVQPFKRRDSSYNWYRTQGVVSRRR
jgi:hypothetical protein